ncbi:MAG TPA: COX15/CtaA family protein, partial [Xanthobacteraceae bacterium]
PLIDGGFVPHAARLLSTSPLWRNFFENTLTVQFDHRMLAYTIWICAVLHAIDAARSCGKSPALTSAITLALAVTLQAALGIWTLLEVAPLSLSLSHQAVAMLVLTAATLHATQLAERTPHEMIALTPAVSQR